MKTVKKRRKARPKTPEGHVSDAVTAWLSAKRILHFRNNVGTARYGNQYVKYGVKGMSDYVAFLRQGETRLQRVIWIECKAAKGRQTYEQKVFQHIAAQYGHDYLLVRELDDLIGFFRSEGL